MSHVIPRDLIPGKVYPAGTESSHFANEPLSRLFRFGEGLRGLGNQGGIRRAMVEGKAALGREEAFTILLDTGKQAEWQNHHDPASGILVYYGDNQTPGKDFRDTKQRGNETFLKHFGRSYEPEQDHHAPFFYFERVGRDVRYVGLALPHVDGMTLDEALYRKTFHHKESGATYENLVARFTILPVLVTGEWLLDLKLGVGGGKHEPAVWRSFRRNRANPGTKSLASPSPPSSEELMPPRTRNHEGMRMTRYRISQSRFREALLRRDACCELCGLDVRELLVASHILPWALSDESQKDDPDNGLVLCVMHDGLFDKGFISFASDGRLLVTHTWTRITDVSQDYAKTCRSGTGPAGKTTCVTIASASTRHIDGSPINPRSARMKKR
ncbi:HNH endonuclease [Exiguobacterium sp. S22-S28]|uniref:HNH endonuclease n=1 Tax=Exiguobacterium sp. S22-S28 TaxID=3342768 RepID=UPI00372D374C